MAYRSESVFELLSALILGPIFIFASPLTFIWLVYTNAQTSHTFLEWVGLIILNIILAALWPIYWLIELIRYLFG